MMNSQCQIDAIYDGGTDVLYIAKSNTRASRGTEDRFGIVWRYAGDGSLIGATVLDIFDRWHDDKRALALMISKGFEIPADQAEDVLAPAFEMGDENAKLI